MSVLSGSAGCLALKLWHKVPVTWWPCTKRVYIKQCGFPSHLLANDVWLGTPPCLIIITFCAGVSCDLVLQGVICYILTKLKCVSLVWFCWLFGDLSTALLACIHEVCIHFGQFRISWDRPCRAFQPELTSCNCTVYSCTRGSWFVIILRVRFRCVKSGLCCSAQDTTLHTYAAQLKTQYRLCCSAQDKKPIMLLSSRHITNYAAKLYAQYRLCYSTPSTILAMLLCSAQYRLCCSTLNYNTDFAAQLHALFLPYCPTLGTIPSMLNNSAQYQLCCSALDTIPNMLLCSRHNTDYAALL